MAIDNIVKTDVLAIAPEFSTLADQAWVDILNYVNQINLTACDSDFDRRLARIFLAAHIGAIVKSGSAGEAGPLTGESAGGVRRSYGLVASATSSGSITTTRYGQKYIEILEGTLVHGPMVV